MNYFITNDLLSIATPTSFKMFCVLIAVDKEAISILHLFQISYQLFVSYVCIIIQGFGKCNTFLQKNEEKREKMSHFTQNGRTKMVRSAQRVT